MNYEDIKDIAARQGASVSDLIALSPNNDPFYVGRPNDWKQAEWFKELWNRFGYSTGVHLRRVHYQVISQTPTVLLPNRWSFIVSAGVRGTQPGEELLAPGESMPQLGPILVPAGALLISAQYTWRGPRVKDGKQLAGEAVRFLPADHQTLPPELRPHTTYYVAQVGEVLWQGERYRWIQVSTRPGSAPLRLTPGTGGQIGEPYENTDRCWDYLTQAGKVARYLGMCRIDAFVDRRNPDPRLYAEVEAPDPFVQVNTQEWSTPELPSMPQLPGYEVGGYSGRQRYHLEIWCEKSTMNDVLLPLCERFSINFVTGLGEMSITSVLNVLERIKAGGRPAIIWYISDYDPAGQSMPVAVSRKIEYLVRGDEDNEPVDIRLIPVVLTAGQVELYKLPRTPIKETERRADAFEARHGEGAVELDAMEALHPGELARILQRVIRQFYDRELGQAVYEERLALQAELEKLQDDTFAGERDEITRLTEDYREIQRQVAELLADWTNRQRRLWSRLAAKLERQPFEEVLEQHPIPEAEESDALLSLDPLYHSERGYNDQLRYYKEHQRKTGVEVEY